MEKMLDIISVLLNLLKHVCGLSCDLSWRIFHVHLKRMCILLFLNGLSCRYILNPSGLMCNSGPHLVFCLHDLSIDVGEVLKFPASIDYYQFLPLHLLIFTLYI